NLSLYDGGKSKVNLADLTKPLRAGSTYFLEVAVRLKPGTALPIKDQRPIGELNVKRPIRILAVADASGFTIAQKVQPLILPPDGESTQNAWFEVVPREKSRSAADFSEIRVALYCEFNLLDVVILQAETRGKFDSDLSAFGTQRPVTVRQERQSLSYADLEHV